MNSQGPGTPKITLLHDLKMLSEALVRGKRMIAIFGLIFGTLGAYYAFSSPKIYSAKAVIQVEQEEQKLMNIEGMKAEDLKALEIIKTFEQSLTAPEVLLRVIRNEKMNPNPDFLPEISLSSPETLLQEALSKHIEAKIRRGTRLIDITVEHRNPKMAQRIAEAVLKEFSEWNFEMEREAGQLANGFLVKEAERLKIRLAKSEQALQTYKEENRAVSLEDKQSLTLDNLKSLNSRVTIARAERIKLEVDCSALNAGSDLSLDELNAVGAIANLPAILELKKAIGERNAHFATIQERYKDQHPKYIEAKSELDTLRKTLAQALRDARTTLVSAYQSAALTEQKLQDALHEQELLALELNKVLMPYAALIRDLESDRAIFASVLTRLKQTDVTKDIAQGAIRVVARPMLPERPIRPRKAFILALTSMAGIALGVCAALAAYAADSTMRTIQDAEAALGIRALGEISNSEPSIFNTNVAPQNFHPESSDLEPFLDICRSIEFAEGSAGRKTIVFASLHPEDGKTYCAANTAIAFARQGVRTLLIDADFRKRSLGRLFNDDELLHTTASAAGTDMGADFIPRETHINNLAILSLFQGHAARSTIMDYAKLRQWLSLAEKRFDRIIINTAQVRQIHDTIVLSSFGGAIYFVIRPFKYTAEDIMRTMERLREGAAFIGGFIWNKAIPSRDCKRRPGAADTRYTGQSRFHKNESESCEQEYIKLPGKRISARMPSPKDAHRG